MSSESRRAVLCVDLDGTLVKTDTLDESLLLMLRHRPWTLFRLPLWLLGGKAHVKEQVALSAGTGFGRLPLRETVLEYIERESADADEVVLATAANWRIAEQVAGECKLFDRVLASDATTNLSGSRKLAAIQQHAGDRPFDYMGDHTADLPIWAAARRAIVVSDSAQLAGRIQGASEVTQIATGSRATMRDWLRQLRVHQWSKNLLLALPLILAHKVTSPEALFACAVAMLAFSFIASSVYITNDLIDLPHDRQHPTKSKRPLARGVITIRQAVAAAAGLVAAAVALSAAFLPWEFLAMAAGYVAMSFAYSMRLKRMLIMDVILLAGFYVYRVLIGAMAIEAPVSTWLLAFSMFFFLSLGVMKRYADLLQAAEAGHAGLPGRSYSIGDADFFRSFGVCCSCVSVLVLALYLDSEQVTQLYSRPKFLWLVCPLALYWIMRAWLVASRGRMPDDPIVFALRDKASYVLAAGTAVLIFLAT